MLPLFFGPPVCRIHGHGHIGLSKRSASFVRHRSYATRRPSAWCERMRLSFASGVASARKSSTPASACNRRSRHGLSPVIMMVLMPIRRSSPSAP